MNKDLSKLIKVWSVAILIALVFMVGLKVVDGNTNRLGTISFRVEE